MLKSEEALAELAVEYPAYPLRPFEPSLPPPNTCTTISGTLPSRPRGYNPGPMRTIFSVLSFVAILAALGCAILLLAWPVSLFAGWLFGLDAFHAAALALGSFLVLAVFFAAAVSERASVPWGGMAD